MFLLVGCGVDFKEHTTKQVKQQPIDCGAGQVPTYKNRFQPVGGASGVASGADAAAGQVSADRPAETPVAVSDAGIDNGVVTAMILTCEQATCPDGQVAVEQLPRSATYGGGATSGAIDSAGPSAGGDALPPSPPADPTPPSPPVTVVCADPPPDCPQGQSPQYTIHNTWECTDCAMVVTYGGAYGNYRRCVNSPTVACPEGQVPTYVLEDEQWECKQTCDNGAYDQHTIDGVMVCVPC